MIRIAISVEAFEAIARTLPLGSMGYVSHERPWDGITTGDANQGNRWTTSRWLDIEATTIFGVGPFN